MKHGWIPFLAATLFLIGAVTYDIYDRSTHSVKAIAAEVGENLTRELNQLKGEMAQAKTSSLQRWSSLKHVIFLIDSGEIKSWSNNRVAIEASMLTGNFSLKLFQTPKRDLLVYREPLDSGQALVGILPLRQEYDIVNQYLPAIWNDRIFPMRDIKIFHADAAEGTPVYLYQRWCQFRIQLPSNPFYTTITPLLLTVCAIIFVCWGFFNVVRQLHRKRKYLLAFVVLFTLLAALRIAMVEYGIPSRWVYSEFFDPRYFASSSFNASVGDFFLNALIVAIACSYLFAVYSRITWIRNSILHKPFPKVFLATTLVAFSFFSFLFPALFIETIFHDSSILIDITSNVDLNALKVVAVAAVLLGTLSSFLFVHVFMRLLRLFVHGRWQIILSFISGAGIFLIYFLSSNLNYWVTLAVGACYFPFAYYVRFVRAIHLVSYKTFSFLLISVVAYSLQGALVVARFAHEKDVRSMTSAAANLISHDVLGEYLLNDAVRRITQDNVLAAVTADAAFGETIRQKIKSSYISAYFDRYDVKIKVFYPDGKSADGTGEDDLASVIRAIQGEANKTAYENVYFVQSSISETAKHYLVVVALKHNGKSAAYVVIDLFLKQIVPQQVYPELLIDSRFSQSIRDKNYNYAFFDKTKMVESLGNFNFSRDFDLNLLEDQRLYSNGIESSGQLLVGAEDEAGNRAVVTAALYPTFGIIANFALHFVVGIGLILALLIGYVSLTRPSIKLNYSAKIQLYIYVAFVVPLVAVSAIALRMIGQSEEAQREKEITDKGLQMTSVVSSSIQSDSLNQLQHRLTELAQATSVDANIYDASGKLLVSTQPGIFSYGLLMPQSNRAAWERIIEDRFNITQERVRVGSLDYNSLFFVIKPSSGNHVLGILEIPFFKSDSAAARINVLSNVLVTFVTVFILFSFLAFQAINTLTSPLITIARKLKGTSLGNNQPMKWDANDEIGLMVKEYNLMLLNLEKNTEELAKTQKESAWREIAQQVAHEIKNPLTPMKLTLQQLQNSGRITDEKTNKAIQTLLDQVDALTGIAGSFSAFAAMPAPVTERVDVVKLLNRATALFASEGSSLRLHADFGEIFVNADEKILGRIFGNIILNAIQSGAGQRIVTVDISVRVDGAKCIIAFVDNGLGIAPDMRDKIFLPHFSTKKSGSGLGLAIAKQGIEQMGGLISFESSDAGTTFFLQLKAL